MEPLAQILEATACLFLDKRHVGDLDGQQDDTVVDDLVVLQVMQQRVWDTVRCRSHKYCRAAYALRRGRRRLDEHFYRHCRLAQPRDHQFAALGPCRQQHENNCRDQQRQPATLGNLNEVRGQIRAIDDQENAGNKIDPPFRPVPDLGRKNADHHRRNEHRAHHSDSISSSEVARFLEG